MRWLAQAAIISWGWRRALLAMAAGSASALAFAPFFMFPVLWLSFPLLVWLIDGVGGSTAGRQGRMAALGRKASAAFIGWCFGFGFFVAGLYWVGEAFLVDADIFGWLMPLAVIGLPAGLALFFALGTALAHGLWSQGPLRIFALASALTATEWLRGHILTGFPWNSLGYALVPFEPLTQAAALFGAEGLAFVCVVIFAAPAVMAAPRAGFATRALLPLLALAILAGLAGYGVWRLPAGVMPTVAGAKLRIVQPAIAQRDKWKPENSSRIFADYLRLSDQPSSPQVSGLGDLTHVIWPESALPFLLEQSDEAKAALAALFPPGTMLITGALRLGAGEPAGADGRQPVYNSILALDETARTIARYDKQHLVPFGEYLPFQPLLEAIGLKQLTRLRGGFASGSGQRTMQLPGLPAVAPLICYEIIFPGRAVDRAQRAQWILNVTNDGWFGDSTGPRQHLHQARIRAIEEGLPVVRAANTGISALIDPYGRIVQQLGLGEAGVIDFELPRALEPSFYARHGNQLLATLLILGILLSFAGAGYERHHGHMP